MSVGHPLVVAADDRARAPIVHRDLSTAQHMAGGGKPDPHFAQGDLFMPPQCLVRGAAVTQPRAHDRQCVGCRQHRAMAGARMIRVAMRDHRPIHRPQRVDEEPARLAEQAVWQYFQPCRGMRHCLPCWQPRWV